MKQHYWHYLIDERKRVLDFIVDGYVFMIGESKLRPSDCVDWYERGCPNEDYDDFMIGELNIIDLRTQPHLVFPK